MEGREPCRSANDIDSIKDLGLSQPARKLVKEMRPADLILSVRNYEIYKFIPSCDIEKSERVHLIEEIEEVVKYQGFLRDDIRNRISPESHFVERYVLDLKLMRAGKCMPFYDSNEVYETYTFSRERLKKILNLLGEFLSKKQLEAVRSDLYNSKPRESLVIKEAKKTILENREAIHKGLLAIFV